jgi:hypothetical protein
MNNWKEKQHLVKIQTSNLLEKYNMNHDDIGRFSTADNNSTGQGGPSSEAGKKAATKISDRSKERGLKHAKEKIAERAKGKLGTETNPIVTKDMKKAARHLSEGKHVRLESAKQLSTLTKELRKLVKEEGVKSINMCKVSVPGTNVFCAQHKGIPRVKMPQTKGKPRKNSQASKLKPNKDGEVDGTKAFLNYARKKGIGVSNVKTVKADQLRASQNELDGVKVLGMIKAATDGKFNPGGKPIFVSKEGYVIDGHHRWAAQVGTDSLDGKLGDLTMQVVEIDMTITEALTMANNFAQSFGIEPKIVKALEAICIGC